MDMQLDMAKVKHANYRKSTVIPLRKKQGTVIPLVGAESIGAQSTTVSAGGSTLAPLSKLFVICQDAQVLEDDFVAVCNFNCSIGSLLFVFKRETMLIY